MGPPSELSDPPPPEADEPGPSTALVGEGRSPDDREFERYALVASLTLCVLSLLLLDGLRTRARQRTDAPRQDRLVRLVLGGIPPVGRLGALRVSSVVHRRQCVAAELAHGLPPSSGMKRVFSWGEITISPGLS